MKQVPIVYVATCVVEPFNEKQSPYIAVLSNAPYSNITLSMCIIWKQNIESLYKHMGKLDGGISVKGVNQKSKIIFLVSYYSACPYKKYTSKYCPELHTLNYFLST